MNVLIFRDEIVFLSNIYNIEDAPIYLGGQKSICTHFLWFKI